MNRVVLVVLAVLICCAYSTPLQEQQAVVERSSRRPANQQPLQQQQSNGVKEGNDIEKLYRDSAEADTGRQGLPRRRLSSAATTNSAARQQQQLQQQQQQEMTGGESTTMAGARGAESRPKPGERSKSTTVLRALNGARRSEAALEGADGQAEQVHEVQAMDEVDGEGRGIRDGVVEPVEGGEAEEDKGIEEGEAEGFVVEARDGKPGEGDPGDSPDNDNASTGGISDNKMVIVFCALAFVANGGFLVYVFWVM